MVFDSSWTKVPRNKILIKDKPRQLEYNKDLNLYKRLRTFDGINHLKNWDILENYMDLQRPLNCLEIGSHEGQSAMYFLKYILNNPKSSLICCDPWIKSHWLNIKPHNLCYEDIFDLNLNNNKGMDKIKKYRGTNSELFREKWFSDLRFDIIYIDDDHTYEHTLENIENCWPKLKEGGVMIFDDYDEKYFVNTSNNKAHDDGAHFCIPVKKAVDEFLEINSEGVEIIFKHYQILIRKIH